MDKIELLGGACFSHGPYTFYKAVRISNNRILRLGSFFLTKLWSDADLVSIGELQLVWIDSRGPNTPLASLRLYFLPENTPDGRRDTHGEDEVLSISEKVVVRVHDLVTCLSPSLEWSWGREVSFPPPSPGSPNGSPYPQVLSDPGLDFSDVERHQKDYETLICTSRRGVPIIDTKSDLCQTRVVVLSYSRYCRYRAVLKRLEGSKPSWQSCAIAAALGGFKAIPGTRVLFCRDTFDYPDLETHELLCNHLAPKLKGRPRRKRKKARSLSPENESSNESEASVASSAAASTSKASSSSKENNAAANNSDSNSGSATPTPGRPPGSTNKRREDRRMEEKKPTPEEKKFVSDVHSYMITINKPLPKMPLLGYRQIDLFLFYKLVQELGGYDRVSANRLWKSIYDEMGGNAGSTSAATLTRRHYERLLLPYEEYQRGVDHKSIQSNRRKTPSLSDVSEDSIEVKRETESPPPSETPPPNDPVQSILSTSPFLPSGKTSSLRSVRVKPERLKSLNTMIATSTGNSTASAHQQQLPSPTTLNATSSSGTSSPTSTPPTSTTPTGAAHNSVLERQLNSPLITQQVPPSCSPTGLPVNTVTNAGTVVTLTPPPEKDMIKLDPKQTMLAQGKENIPLYEAKSPNFVDKPGSPEVIDLETENESGAREKLIIPSFKKRKLEILREGGLEVTAVDCADTRPSVIQPTTTTTTVTSTVSNLSQSSTTTTMNTQTTSIPLSIPTISANITTTFAHKSEERSHAPSCPNTKTGVPMLINVTVTPDIGHILPRESNRSPASQNTPSKQQATHQSSSSPTPNQASPNSRVINLGHSNSSLMHLYNTANMPMPHSLAAQGNSRFMPSPNVPNGRPVQLKVTQGKSIFSSNNKMVYGDPKALATPKYMSPVEPMSRRSPSVLHAPSIRDEMNSQNDAAAVGVLDLTQKPNMKSERQSYSRPSLEIVKVPVVIRPNREVNHEARNLETHRHLSKPSSSHIKEPSRHIPPHEAQRKTPQFVTGSVATNAVGGAYGGVLDSRTMASNNLEITLVSPKKTAGETGTPQLSPSSRSSNNVPSPTPNQRRQSSQSVPPPSSQHLLNGKTFPKRVPSLSTPLSPYTPRKSSSSHSSSSSNNHHPVIPNVPNLSHLNAAAMAASGYPKPNHMPNYPPYFMMDSNLSEAEKLAIQQQRVLEAATKHQQSRESESNSRRSSIPTLPPGFMPGMSPASQSFMDHHLKARLKDQFAGASNGSIPPFMLDPAEAFNGSFDPLQAAAVAAMAAAAATARSNNQLPMFDPAQLSAFYGLLSSQGPALPPNPAAPFMASPEFSTYYKELLASTAAAQQSRSMGGQSAPTSK